MMDDKASSPLAARKEQALERLRRAKAKLQKIEGAERSAARKADTRRKVLLGAKVLAEMQRVKGLDKVVLSWIDGMEQRDKPLFTDLEAELTKRLQEPA